MCVNSIQADTSFGGSDEKGKEKLMQRDRQTEMNLKTITRRYQAPTTKYNDDDR